MPEDLSDAPIDAFARPPKRVRRVETRHLAPMEPPSGDPVAVLLDRLWTVVESRRLSGDPETSHAARLLARGTAKIAQKLGEEAVETVIEAMIGNRAALICESADLLYHLIVVWVDAGIRPEQVWAELVRREGISGIAEQAVHGSVRAGGDKPKALSPPALHPLEATSGVTTPTLCKQRRRSRESNGRTAV